MNFESSASFYTLVQLRRDLAINWTNVNPVLGQAEPGYEIDTGKLKFGDGVSAWNSLPYFPAASGVTSINGLTGDVTLSTSNISEGSNLYFTDIRAVSAIKADPDWNATNWDLAHSWGDHSTAGYLTSFTESDPVFGASPAAGITSTNISNWNTAFGWGDWSTGVNKTFVDALNINAQELDSLDSAAFLRSNANNTGATGIISTSNQIEAGRGSGSVSLTPNDGYGNANVAFNHKAGLPDVSGSSARITSSVDGTTATFAFQLADNVTAGVAVSATQVAYMSLTEIQFNRPLEVSSATKLAGHFYSGTTNPTNTNRLNFDGNLYATDFKIPSDRALKKNIHDLNSRDSLHTIMNLSPKSYQWKEDDRNDIGLIAQEAHEICPLVAEEKSINYSKLTTYLIGAVQEQQKEIDLLRSRIEFLEVL